MKKEKDVDVISKNDLLGLLKRVEQKNIDQRIHPADAYGKTYRLGFEAADVLRAVLFGRAEK